MQARRVEGRGYLRSPPPPALRRSRPKACQTKIRGLVCLLEDPTKNIKHFSQELAALSAILTQVLTNRMGQLSCQRKLNV